MKIILQFRLIGRFKYPLGDSVIMYRKEIKVLDCTIRDGGLMNNHLFSDEIVRGVFHAVNESGVDYIELGYKADVNQFKRGEYGPMKFCSEKDLENVIGDTKLNC